MIRSRVLELWRIVPATALAAAVLLVLGGLFATVYGEQLYSAQKLKEVDLQAQILAEAMAAPLEFSDPSTAEEYVSALRANTEIEAVGVYDAEGALIAGYALPEAAPLPSGAALGAEGAGRNRIQVVAPVAREGREIGSVYLRALRAPLAGQVLRFGVIALFAVMAALVLGVLTLAHAALANAAQQLAERERALKTSNRERERAEQALRQSQKMEAIGQLTGGVAHDFNNLLAAVLSGLRLLQTAETTERRAQILQAMTQSVDRGTRLIKQLLVFARRQPLNPQVIAPGPLIAGMRELLQRSLREDIRVEIVAPEDLWPIEVDPSELELAILNLAVNARDAMPNGGLVEIEGRNLPNGGAGGSDAVRITVRDTGAGMPADVARRAFEPFFTTKDIGKGTGLGLSHVYGFATQSGGSSAIDSEVGVGTTVSLILPRSHGKPAAPEVPAAAQPATPVGGPGVSVLVVEDDDMVAATVGPLIEQFGHRCTRVSTAAEALELLSTGAAFDVVFSDIMMPGGVNGLDLARILRKRSPETGILLTTGYSAAVETATAEFPVLRKPYRPEELEQALAGTLRRRS